MKKILIPAVVTILLLADACKKADEQNKTDMKSLEKEVLVQFVDVVARPQYTDLAAKADILYSSIQTLQSSATEAHLTTARNAWKDLRAVWERCEGFLFGPVEDDYYDPYMDTWPIDYVQMDSLLASPNAITLSDIEGITLSLRGFHPIEYILFGLNGTRKAGDITNRQKEYIFNLAADVRNNCRKLADAWSPTGGNYGMQIVNAGANSSGKYTSRREVFLAMADGLIEICEGSRRGQDGRAVCAARSSKGGVTVQRQFCNRLSQQHRRPAKRVSRQVCRRRRRHLRYCGIGQCSARQ